ncbi:uncharacterized protein LOC107414988 isoform X1 [Ziziphus jujuba]|uniref:Uncharacterized protein LOC107414988 isoform X1 n=1 Tax=Ziziphus jujuba TaxID=326968 RepID=A0A6P3ZGN7_ZIZJJ|nr:uncharacterized protein LOC107414988 isoform X1 [Ziziphus jujuba]
MMGFGAYGNGGSYSSSSSSNLSASAPPFTVDRSIPKTPSNPLVDLTEPSYAAPLNSSLHNWLPTVSPTSASKLFSNPSLEFSSVPSTNAYKYGGLRNAESSNSHLPPLNTVAPAATNAFTYGQCSDSVGTGYVEAEPYYPSFLSPAMRNDSSLVIPDQTTYDWLSSSNVPALDGSFHNDYSQRQSGSKYVSQWGGLWNGLAEWDQGKLQEIDGSACSKGADSPASSVYRNYMNQDAHALKSLNTCAEVTHGISMLGGPVNSGKLEGKSFLGQDPNFIPVDYSRSLLESPAGFPETHHESLSLEFLPSSRNSQIPFGTLHEKKDLRQNDASLNDSISISKSSPAPVVRPPVLVPTSLALNAAPVETVNLGSDAETDLHRSNSFNIKEIHSPMVSECKVLFDPSQLSIHLERNNPVSWELPLTKTREIVNKESINNDSLNHILKAKSGLQISDLTVDGFNLDLNIIDTINSIEDSSETVDQYNPSVDSPCWKGSSLSRFSPFEAPAVLPQQMKNLDNSLNVQAKKVSSLSPDNKVFSQKPSETMMYHESGCSENSSTFPMNIRSVANSVFEDNISDDTVKNSYHLETRCGKEFQHSDDAHGHGSRSSCSDLKHSPITQQGLEDELVSENNNGTLEHDSSPLHFHEAVETVPSVPVEDAGTNLTKSNGEQPTLTTNVPGLVNKMCSLSELLLLHCTNGLCELKQKDLEAVKSVINNLSMCMSKNVEQGTLIHDSTSSQKNISESNEVHKSISDGSQMTDIDFQDELDLLSDHQGNRHCVSGKKHDKKSYSCAVRDDLDMVKEEKMTQALKKVLSENFYDEEETESKTLLYKNLWLEAEATLCSINCKARFNRMKMEMEKSELLKSEDVCENTTVMKKPSGSSRSEVSSDPNTVDVFSPQDEEYLLKETQYSSMRNITSQADDVMARFHILRCRVENSDSLNAANLDEPSSSKIFPDPNKADKIPFEEQKAKGSLKSDGSIQESINFGTKNFTNDFEASVMDRFHILKSRDDNSSSICTEAQEVPEVVDLGYVGKRNHKPVIGRRLEEGRSDLKMDPIIQHNSGNSTEGKLTVKEFHLFVDEDPLVQSRSSSDRSGNQLLGGWDWEHVMKEELGGKNR